MAVKTIIRLKNDVVMVFDADDEQVPEYQGSYDAVRDMILKYAPGDAVFAHWFGYSREPEIVARESW